MKGIFFRLSVVACLGLSPVSARSADDMAMDDLLRQIVGEEARTSVSLTVYSDDIALVRERREIALPPGEFVLEYRDVARTIDPASVTVTSIGGPPDLRVYEQSYRYDLLNKQTLLERFVGRKLKYSRSVLEGKRFEKVLREGRLLSINPEVVQFGDEIEIEPEGTISLAYLPDDLKTTPTLMWRMDNPSMDNEGLEVSYLAGGFTWRVDYLMTLMDRGTGSKPGKRSENPVKARLEAWATLENHSGTAFRNATVKLVAGDVRRLAGPSRQVRHRRAEAMAMKMEADVLPAEEALFEYHLYDFPRRISLGANAVKQVRLLESATLEVSRHYRFTNPVMQYQEAGERRQQHASVLLRFANDEGNRLGKPLPGGRVRVSMEDGRHVMQFIGEDRISHTPRGASVELNVGRAFDVTAARKQMSYRRMGDRGAEVSYSVAVRNSKKHRVEVTLDERFQGDWVLVRQNRKGKRVDSTTQRYEMTVPAGAEETLEYTARFVY